MAPFLPNWKDIRVLKRLIYNKLHNRRTRVKIKSLKLTNENKIIQNRRSSAPRLFVALYDYDPLSQSPNEDAAEVFYSAYLN